MKSSCIVRGLLTIAMLWMHIGYAQLTKAEYFFDNDPGPGNSNVLSVIAKPGTAFDSATFSGSIPVPANLKKGVHLLYIRFFDAIGGWGIYETKPFRVLDPGTNVSRLEYFFDTDPGVGNGTLISINSNIGAEFDISTYSGNIPVPSTLEKGWHQLYFRLYDVNGGWGIYESKPFQVLDQGTNLQQLEYYFDNDPGVGNGSLLAFDAITQSNGTFNGNINTSGLTAGIHILYVRAKHKNGSWSQPEARPFNVFPSDVNTRISAAEYFYDADPGFGNGISLPISGIPEGANIITNIATTGLSAGYHMLYVRTKGATGGWGNYEAQSIFIHQVIDKIEWFTDADPGAGNGTPLVIIPGRPLVSYLDDITLPGCLNLGTHKLYIRARTSDGLWGLHDSASFSINQTASALALSEFPTVMHPCPGNAFDVKFTSSGAYTAGNIFKVLLSDATGSFNAPVEIGSLTVSPTGCQVPHTISVTIPDATPNGSGYRIRVVSSAPVQQADSAENITIQPGNTYYRDADGDGYGNEFETTIACSKPTGYVENADDCNDNDGGVFEGIRYYIDADGDGYGKGSGELFCASSAPDGYSANNNDCNDGDISVHQEHPYYIDSDADGYGSGAVVMLCAATVPAGYSINNTDCNDNDVSVNSAQGYYVDSDGDGYGIGPVVMLCAATAPAGYSLNNTDCNDANGLVHDPQPFYADGDGDGYGAGAVVMLCNHVAPAGYSVNNADCNDADGLVHEAQRFYTDADGDGFGFGSGEMICSSTVPAGYSANNNDCDDGDALQKPGQVWFTDADGDGYATGTSVTQCLRSLNGKLAAELTATSGDCDDNNAQVNPVSQTLSFSGNAGFENSFIAPATGTPYTTFNFEVKYTDATNSLPPYGYPRVLLDFEGNGNYTGGNDRTIVMSPVDVTDNTTSDGKVFRGSISQLATGSNWKSSVLVVNGSCSTQTALSSYPVVQVLPDLEIFANDIIMSAANPPVASPLTVTATIHNRSDFAAQNFAVRLINQYDPLIDYGDIIVSTIPAHSSGTVTWNITTPPDPAWCPLQVVVDATNLIDETNELNNTALRPFTNGNYNVPGAIEVTANASPEVSYPQYGASVGISGKAIYTGTAVPLVDPSVAGAQVELTLLETGQTFSGTTNSAGNFYISIPRPIAVGVYHVQGTITDFTLTGAFATQFTLIVAPCQTDLTSRVSLSANQLVEGQSLNAAFTITNSGCAPSAPTKMWITQSGGSPSAAGSFDVPALIPGGSFTHTVNSIVFANEGTYGFSVTADANDTEIEQFENNNISYAYVNVLPNLPDLAPYDGSRGNYAFCNTLPNSVSFILRNSGGAASGPFTTDVKVYVDGNYTETLTHNVPGIGAQGLYSFSLPYNFTAIGSYTFSVEIDTPLPNGIIEEVSEANNTASYGIGITACPPPVANLVLLGESCQRNTSLDPVDPQFPGTMTLTARAHNAGNLTAPGPIEVSFSLSNGTSYTGTYAGSLAPGQTQSISVTVPTVAPATQTLTTMVDPRNLVPESNETDNVNGPESLCWNFKPTVWCQSGPWGQRYVVNQSFQPRMEVIAEGLYYASQVKVRFEVSGPGIAGYINLGDATIDNPRRVCAPYCHPVASLPSTFVFQEEGVYTFRMTVDPDNAYTECNEGDNVMSINVAVVSQPDMRILSQYINPSKLNPDVNEPVTLLVSYENLGVNNINDRMKMKILVDEVELTTVSNVAGLITGDKATIAIPTPWSSPLVGAHIIRAIIDSDNSVAEANETNNEATRAIIVGALANLRFNSFAPSNAFPSVGEGITLNATIWNDGDEATDGEVEFLYINNNGDSVSIGKLPVSVIAGGTQNIQLPWFVTQVPANLVAKIVNATMLEATYDDNIATAAIGSFTVVVNSEAACGTGNGKLTAVVTGGKAPFTFEWNTGATGALLNAAPGTYQVTVTDAGGRTASGEGTIGASAGTTYYADADGDGFGAPGNTTVSCTGAPVGYVSNNLDCNDGNIAINPAATEVCDGIDNDCDGLTDEGFTTKWYRDFDTDGFGDNEVLLTNCTQPSGYVVRPGDCNDNDNTIYPNAPELCDGKDNDCDGATDEEGQATWYQDADGDGYGSGNSLVQCGRPAGYKLATELTATTGDCDDSNPSLNPATVWYKDADNDGYSDGTTLTQCTQPADYKLENVLISSVTDCNDGDAAINPATVWYRDADNDGYSDGTTLTQCTQPADYKLENVLISSVTDCNDADAAINPATVWYRDADNDGYSDGATLTQCDRTAGYKLAAELTAITGDCDDDDGAINPRATEICDGKDNDCDGQVDEGVKPTWYKDTDNDGYSNGATLSQCERPAGYKLAGELTATTGDCNDTNAAVRPGATEVCNGIDDDCDGLTDEGCSTGLITWYRDADKDGFGNPNPAYIKIQATKPRNYVANNLDCRDWDPLSYPGAPETGDGIDNNCDGLVDEGLDCLHTWYYDGDNDGFGADAYTRLSCKQHNGYVPLGGDCKNWDASVYPNAPELCDGKDNDCDGLVDESCTSPIITGVQKPAVTAKPLAKAEEPVLEVSLWPNPARDVLMVTLDEFEPGKKLEMVLMQVDGRAVSTQSLVPAVKGQQVRFDVRAMSAGYYLLQVKQGGLSMSKRVVIAR